MNNVDYLKSNQFPASSETLKYIQDMIVTAAKLASLGGTNYILSGCTYIPQTDSYGPGYVVLAGEILPFVGGSRAEYVLVDETKTGVEVGNTNYDDLYTDRRLIFTLSATQYRWFDFKRISTNEELRQLITDTQGSITELRTAFDSHLSGHGVDWNNISNKPSTYPHSAHSHNEYALASHAHPGMIFMGDMDGNFGDVTKLGGSILVSGVVIGEGIYELTHNIGHHNYIVLGVGNSGGWSSLRGMVQITNLSVRILVSDDDSGNYTGIRFVIYSY